MAEESPVEKKPTKRVTRVAKAPAKKPRAPRTSTKKAAAETTPAPAIAAPASVAIAQPAQSPVVEVKPTPAPEADVKPAPAPEAKVATAPAPQQEAAPAPAEDNRQPRNDRGDRHDRTDRGDRYNDRRNRNRRNDRNDRNDRNRRNDRGDYRDNRDTSPVLPLMPIHQGLAPDPTAIKVTQQSRQADREALMTPEPPPAPKGAENLTLLGAKQTVYSDTYSPARLETFINKHQDNDYWVKFNCPEFTSLCPITGQPDFATIYISYIPDKLMVESKSLKLYLFGFRNHGAFHEDCVNLIMKDLIKLMSPRYIEITGKFLPRGGISIDPYCNYGRPSTPFEEIARKRLVMHDINLERVDNR